MRILLLGSQGQIGQELRRTLSPLGELICWHRQQIDLAQLEQLYKAVLTQQPNLIVNAAAYTTVDQAESEPELAHLINGAAPKQLAIAARDCNATVLHLSTDYVFEGNQGFPYAETDVPNPQSVYGRSKLAGEQAIQSVGGCYAILRTAWVYGCYGQSNFVKTMLRLVTEHEHLRIVADQIGSPTWAKDIATTVAAMVPHIHANQFASGIYHYTNSGAASWYDFAMAIFEEAMSLGFLSQVPELVPITTQEYPLPALRPAYSMLSGTKLRNLLGQHPPHWRHSLRRMLTDLFQKTL